MLRRHVIACLLLLLTAVAVFGQRREIHMLGVNDMHAAIDNMPQLIGIIDSLRTLYPSLLVFSAGDNRTGNPVNDKYEPSGYPMVALMNMAGFNASAVGNHEFDAHSLPRLCGLSAFRYLCANMTADDSTGVSVQPCQVFDVEGLKVGVFGLIQVGSDGTPDAHPDELRGLHFTSPFETVSRYRWLSEQCDATVLLSHVGYQDDLRMADENPWIDVIIGGHTHRQLAGTEPLRSGVLVTQNRNLLGQAVHVTLAVDSGRVVDKQVDYISVVAYKHPNAVAQAMVNVFNDNPAFRRVLTRAETPFNTRNEIGTMVCDALMSATGADVAIMNYRGIRVSRMHDGNITVRDALEIDPYGSKVVVMDMRGDELERFIVDYGKMNTYKFPHLGGLRADLTLERKGSNDITKVTLKSDDGSRFNRRKTYRVVTNSYVVATSDMPVPPSAHELNTTTSDIIMSYLEQQTSVSYQGKGHLNYISER